MNADKRRFKTKMIRVDLCSSAAELVFFSICQVPVTTPPSTLMTAPLTNDAASDASQR